MKMGLVGLAVCLLVSCSSRHAVVVDGGAVDDGALDRAVADFGANDGPGDDAVTPGCEPLNLLIAGPLDEHGVAIAATADGGLVVAGSFTGRLELAGTVYDRPTESAFVLRLSARGQPLWARVFGGTGEARATDLAIAPNGDILVIGERAGSIDFGSGAVGGDEHVFLARLSTAERSTRWVRHFGPLAGAEPSPSFDGTVPRIAATLSAIYFSVTGHNDVVVAQTDLDGTLLWAHRYAGAGTFLDADASGFVVGGKKVPTLPTNPGFVTVGAPDGTVRWTATPKPGPVSFAPDGAVVTASNTGTRTYVSTYEADGLLRGAFDFGTKASSGVFARALAVAASGEIAITGGFGGTLQIGGKDLATSAGSGDVFALRYSADGVLSSFDTLGGTDLDEGRSIAFDAAGNLLILAQTQSDLTFGAGQHLHQGQDLLIMRRCR